MKRDIGPIAKKYDIRKIELFGSYASETQTEHSDADFLVEFTADVPSIFKVMGFKAEVEKALEIPVDIVTLPLVRPGKMRIEKAVTIYEAG
ncbi:MAG: nucleotidyltransferase domain-containing protein [Clostridiales bacterium]|nr:nucleotidyltransferase domain-containing protein [Clostridiales bacterium]